MPMPSAVSSNMTSSSREIEHAKKLFGTYDTLEPEEQKEFEVLCEPEVTGHEWLAIWANYCE